MNVANANVANAPLREAKVEPKACPIIDWQKGTLEWREPKLGKELPKLEKPLRTPTTITEEEEDEEEYLN